MRNRDGKYSLMFEEFLRDSPFLISPRITFEVSVRLLGGLMTLGYTITTILKRVSRVFSDEGISVKIDTLEQWEQKFIQVQGKDRTLVGEAAKKLGLEGSYVPHPYIEQIKLEKLSAELMTLPDDLKTKLSINDTLASSPMPSFSWISEVKPEPKNLYSKSWTRNTNKDSRIGLSTDYVRNQQSVWKDVHCERLVDRCPDSPTRLHGNRGFSQMSEQFASLNERIDELLLRLGVVETKLYSSICNTQTRSGSNGSAGSLGKEGGCKYLNGHVNGIGLGNGPSPPACIPSTAPAMESPVVKELRMLARGLQHMTTQLDTVNNCLRELNGGGKHARMEKRGWWDDLLSKTKTNEVGLVAAVGLVVLGLGGLAGVLAIRASR